MKSNRKAISEKKRKERDIGKEMEEDRKHGEKIRSMGKRNKEEA